MSTIKILAKTPKIAKNRPFWDPPGDPDGVEPWTPKTQILSKVMIVMDVSGDTKFIFYDRSRSFEVEQHTSF